MLLRGLKATAAFVKDGFHGGQRRRGGHPTTASRSTSTRRRDRRLDVVAAETNKLTGTRTTVDGCSVPTATPSALPHDLDVRADGLVQPTPGPTVTFKPTQMPTDRPTNKQFHCESNVFRGIVDKDTSRRAAIAEPGSTWRRRVPVYFWDRHGRRLRHRLPGRERRQRRGGHGTPTTATRDHPRVIAGHGRPTRQRPASSQSISTTTAT